MTDAPRKISFNTPAQTATTPPPVVPTPTPEVASRPTNQPEKLIHPMKRSEGPNMVKTVISALVIVLAGSMTGFGLSKVAGQSTPTTQQTVSPEQIAEDGVKVGDIIGTKDNTFKDSAEGVLVKGGIDGEGSHHLMRPGGPAQNVYLTSSVLDLDELENHKVKVWGETFAAQKAGWLMDVGRVEVVELNAEKPYNPEQ